MGVSTPPEPGGSEILNDPRLEGEGFARSPLKGTCRPPVTRFQRSELSSLVHRFAITLTYSEDLENELDQKTNTKTEHGFSRIQRIRTDRPCPPFRSEGRRYAPTLDCRGPAGKRALGSGEIGQGLRFPAGPRQSSVLEAASLRNGRHGLSLAWNLQPPWASVPAFDFLSVLICANPCPK